MVAHTSAGAHAVVHAPKHETFDLVAKTNVDPKGFVRVVDEYRVEPWGLYMARPSDHAHFDYLESWLLPALGLRASVFHYLPAHARDQDYYVDIGEYTAGTTEWTSVDHYLDLSVRTGRDYDLLDVDELFDARVAQHLDHRHRRTDAARLRPERVARIRRNAHRVERQAVLSRSTPIHAVQFDCSAHCHARRYATSNHGAFAFS